MCQPKLHTKACHICLANGQCGIRLICIFIVKATKKAYIDKEPSLSTQIRNTKDFIPSNQQKKNGKFLIEYTSPI
uniref:Retrovirus-related Pol polyprotein from transposon TNT 1-94 n=1 Tax=Rhizophora mucronata TaxID=61149 RepID=A0A2P2JIU2_RHIMU